MSKWLTPGEAAERLGDITPSGIRWLADTRQVRSVRTPTGRRLISAADLERLRTARDTARPERKVILVK